MKKFNGFEAKKSAGREQLPAGGYVAKIMAAEEVHYDWGDVLLISFDIAEGQYQGFFASDYKSQDKEDKKWRGTYRARIPADDGSEKDEWTKRSFGNTIWAVEDSNNGYHWDWNESSLKGKTVGVLYRNKEWEMNGNTGWTTECCAFASASDVRDGKFKMPKDKPLKKSDSTAASAFSTFSASDDEELPF